MTLSDANLPETDIDELFLRYCDGALSAHELARLSELIEDNHTVRSQFLTLCIHAATLPEHQAVMRASTNETAHLQLPKPTNPRNFSSTLWKFAAAACLCLCVTAPLIFIASRGLEPDLLLGDRPALGSLSRSTGLVRIGNVPIDLRTGTPPSLLSGDTVSTIGVDASAELTLLDGTSVLLSSNTEAKFEGPLGRCVTVRHGNLAAAAASLDQTVPLRISTPEANVASQGTRLLLSRADGKTRVGVVEGKVRVTDPTDQMALEMNAGDQAEALSGEVRRIPNLPIPQAVAFRFSPTARSGWQLGKLSFEDLLPGSIGALRTIPKICSDGLLRHTVESENCWTTGMFSIHPDTWVSVRYRIKEAGWFEMIVVARSHDIRHRPGVVFAAPPDILNCQPGVWRTVHYRLADFKVVESPEVPSPLVGFVLGLNSGARDVGLSVDQVWINRGEAPAPFPE
jgi:hypothetical protein